MKIKITVALLIAMCAVAAVGRGDRAAHRREVVLLQAYQITTPGPVYSGLLIYNSSSSSGAPVFPNYPEPMRPLAEGLAELLSDGYEIEHESDNGMNYRLVKP